METPKPPHSMCITVRVDEETLTGLMAEVGKNSLSYMLNEKTKRALKLLIDEVHDNGHVVFEMSKRDK